MISFMISFIKNLAMRATAHKVEVNRERARAYARAR